MFVRPSTLRCLLCAATVFVGGTIAMGAMPPRACAAEPAGTKLNALLKEKLAVLQTVAAQTAKLYETGQGSFADVVEVNRAVLQAELELCETDKERIAVLEKMLAQAKDFERQVAEHVRAAVVPASAALKAKVQRLEIEIAMERIAGK